MKGRKETFNKIILTLTVYSIGIMRLHPPPFSLLKILQSWKFTLTGLKSEGSFCYNSLL